jgi:hypothetical protein
MINPVDPFMETEPILKCIAPNQYSFVIAHPKGIISSRFVFLTSNIPNEGLKIRLFSFSFQLSALKFQLFFQLSQRREEQHLTDGLLVGE